jgi:threonine dehydrogenase-like Zn-dependent dehydrogenase
MEIEDAPVPEPGPHQLRVRLEGCGLCASNMAAWEGQPWFSYPFPPGAMGHEGWGVVDAVGDDVRGFRAGERVAFLSNNAYAEYDLAEDSAALRLPRELDDQLFPGEAIACAVSIFRKSRITRDDTVAIIGVGFLGALLTSLAARSGARVIGISRRESSLALARRFGATETIPMSDHASILAKVNELTDGHGADVVVEAVGKQWPLDLAAEITRESGRMVIAGYHQDGPRQVNMQLWNWRAFEVINAHERRHDRNMEALAEAARLVGSGALDPRPLYTHTFPLESIREAFRTMDEKPEGFLKAVVLM